MNIAKKTNILTIAGSANNAMYSDLDFNLDLPVIVKKFLATTLLDLRNYFNYGQDEISAICAFIRPAMVVA